MVVKEIRCPYCKKKMEWWHNSEEPPHHWISCDKCKLYISIRTGKET